MDKKINAPTVLHAFESGKGKSWYPHSYDVVFQDADGNRIDVGSFNILPAPAANKYAFQLTDEAFDGKMVTVILSSRSTSDDAVFMTS